VVVWEPPGIAHSNSCSIRVETLSADGANNPLNEWILPRESRCRDDFLDVERLGTSTELIAEHAVAITNEKSRCRAPRKRLDDLLRRP
jgi:hypothetical protein